MRFLLAAYEPDYRDKNTGRLMINGATLWLHNICLALKEAGHDATVIDIANEQHVFETADYVLVQSEWDDLPQIKNLTPSKKICLLGHFIKHVYPDPRQIKAYRFITTWKGECVEPFNATYIPHAYSDLMDKENYQFKGQMVFSGNYYPLRRENWFEGLNVSRLEGIMPEDLFGIYRASNVCLNIHGDFQKGIVSNEPSRIADKPGEMINERFWQVLGCGGNLITDFVPQMLDFFDESELVIGKTPEEYREKANFYLNRPEELNFLLKSAREKVRAEHTYRNRVKQLIDIL